MPRFDWKRAKPSVITLADRARDAGQWDLAARYYRAALQRSPQKPPIWIQYGHVLKESGELPQAEEAYRTAIAYDRHTADAYLQLGHVLKIQGKKEEARASYLRAFASDPSNDGASLELARLGWSGNHFSELRGMLEPSTGSPRSLITDGPIVNDVAEVVASGPGDRPRDYAEWIMLYDTLDNDDRKAITAAIAEMTRPPLISVVMPVYETPEPYLRAAIDSVRQQLYPYWELCIADDASTTLHIGKVLEHYRAIDSRIKVYYRSKNGHICAATNSALELATGEFVALLDHDDLLSETALYEVVAELIAYPDADVVYSDSDHIDDVGRRWLPYFKTDWNPDLMLGHNMVSHLGVYRRSLVEKVGKLRPGTEGSQDYDLMLRVADLSAPHRIRHIPALLYHWRRKTSEPSFSETSLERCVVAARRAIREHLERTGVLQARIEVPAKCPHWTRVIYPLPDQRPLVSIIVPTRDKASLLARCADGILMRTDYQLLELIIVDNDSKEAETHALFGRLAEEPRVRIIRYPGEFNYAAINNCAVGQALGDIIVLMNNDVDVFSPHWLEEMVSHALRPGVGAVGAKLLYPDGRVQHAGVVLGIGHGAGHFFQGAPRDMVDPWGFLWLVRRVSAVTAACMALRRSVYLQVGGLDEVNFPIAFNDVDFCLRIGQRGYAIVWTPHAELYHLESATRGADIDQQRLARLERDGEQLRARWGELLDRDPFYNTNCSFTGACFEPGFPPRRPKPWQPCKDPLNGAPGSPLTALLPPPPFPPPLAGRADTDNPGMIP